MFFTRWPSLLLTLALLITVGVCLKRVEFLLIDEVKALISIAFGFASSCLLLSLVWLLQRKPMHSTWPSIVSSAGILDPPNMHPRASIGSEQDDDRRRNLARSTLDRPPDYADALVNSKPISWIVAGSNKDQKSQQHFVLGVDANDLREQEPLYLKREDEDDANGAQEQQQSQSQSQPQIDSRRGRSRSDDHEPQSRHQTYHKISSSHSMTQLALNIVRGFTGVEAQPQTTDHLGTSSSSAPARQQHGRRKVSYCQLDVNQLMASQDSPPKYCEITMPRVDNQEVSNQSNEPRSGISPNV